MQRTYEHEIISTSLLLSVKRDNALIIGMVGSRKFGSEKNDNDAELWIKDFISGMSNYHRIAGVDNLVVISGGATGTDRFVEECCKNHKIKFYTIRPQIREYGKPKAFHKRNDFIVKVSDKVIAFWNGRFPRSGTASVINKAVKKCTIFLFLANACNRGYFSELLPKDFIKARNMYYSKDGKRRSVYYSKDGKR